MTDYSTGFIRPIAPLTLEERETVRQIQASLGCVKRCGGCHQALDPELFEYTTQPNRCGPCVRLQMQSNGHLRSRA